MRSEQLVNKWKLYINKKCSRYIYTPREYYVLKKIIHVVYLTEKGHYGSSKKIRLGDLYTRVVSKYNSEIREIYSKLKKDGLTDKDIKKTDYKFILKKKTNQNEYYLTIINEDYVKRKFDLIWTLFFNVISVGNKKMARKGKHAFVLVSLNEEGKRLIRLWGL